MNKTSLIAVAFALLAFVGCSRQQNYDFEAAFRTANASYFGSSRTEAEHALTTFLAVAEKKESAARHEHSLDYDRVLGMSSLKLWSVYDAAGDSAHAETALNDAVRYFDKIPQFSSDPRYQSDKRKSLIEFLNQSETYQKPKWKTADSKPAH